MKGDVEVAAQHLFDVLDQLLVLRGLPMLLRAAVVEEGRLEDRVLERPQQLLEHRACERQPAVLLATHDLELVVELADDRPRVPAGSEAGIGQAAWREFTVYSPFLFFPLLFFWGGGGSAQKC